MMPKSDLVGTVPAVKGQGIPAIRPKTFPDSATAEKNFSVVVSKAIARTPEPVKSSDVTRAEFSPKAKVFDPAQIQDSVTGSPQTATAATFRNRREQTILVASKADASWRSSQSNAPRPSPIPVAQEEGTDSRHESRSVKARPASNAVPSKTGDLIDASIVSAVMTAMVQPNAASAIPRLRNSSKADGGDLSIETESNEASSTASTNQPVRFSTVAPVEERGTQEESSQKSSSVFFASARESVLTSRLSSENALHTAVPTDTSGFAKSSSPEDFQNPVHKALQAKDLLTALAADDGFSARVNNASIHSRAPARHQEKSENADAPQQVSQQDASSTSAIAGQSADSDPGRNHEIPKFDELPGQAAAAAQSSGDFAVKGGSSQPKQAIHAGTVASESLDKAPFPNPSPPETTSVSDPQNVDSQAVASVLRKEVEGASAIDGTRAALSKQRMKFAGEKNDIAGSVVQKLPGAADKQISSDNMSAKAKPQSEPNLPKQLGDAFFPGSLAYYSSNAAVTEGLIGKGHQFPQMMDSPASQVERVAHLVAQEVLTVRQSSATALAVSLKVDTHTELFLQLTNHDGRVQASLSCERGSIDHLGEHWTELQQSLARQNIQLMPLEDKTGTRVPAIVTPAAGSVAARPFDQSPQNRQQQLRDPQGETQTARVTATGRVSGKTKSNNRSRQGWETWA
ncbi:MAG TPA: hypothetical protein VGO67_24000 [Verrucomicrobiae bacterium]|jgi:hypothetical protein